MNRALNKKHTVKLRTRLIVFFLMTTLITIVMSIYMDFTSRAFITSTNSLFSKSIELNRVYDTLSKAQKHLELFLSTKSSESFTSFSRCEADINEWAQQALARTESTRFNLMMINIAHMTETYLEKANLAAEAKRGRNIDRYVQYYDEASQIAARMYRMIDQLSVDQLRQSTQAYQNISGRITAMQWFNAVLMCVVVVVNIGIIMLFSHRFTLPITQLVNVSRMVSQGNFEIEPFEYTANDEISVLSHAFYQMVGDLKAFVSNIQEKAQLEMSLKEERMRNMAMQNELRDAEFKALQAQINPHFIYNTINIGAQIALLEHDDKTCTFLENVAEIFRYNLKSMASPVTLREELENIRAFMYVYKMRFADLVEYVEEVASPPQSLGVKMPRLTLQPIVENAYKHGLSENENGGRITLSVRSDGARLLVSVEDNGKGMEAETLTKIVDGNSGDGLSLSSTGIGLNNIIKRLELFYARDDVFCIESTPGKGTRVILRLPLTAL